MDRAAQGVIGTGTLKITGEIHNVGGSGSGGGNTIASNLDFSASPGGIGIIRIGTFLTPMVPNLIVTGQIIAGSVLKTIGQTNLNGTFLSSDAVGLFGNNTTTGSVTINGGTSSGGPFSFPTGSPYNLATGTNASTTLNVVFAPFSLQGANGSFGAATTVNVQSGGLLVLDNSASTSGNNVPAVAAATNGNRLADNAVLNLTDGALGSGPFAMMSIWESLC